MTTIHPISGDTVPQAGESSSGTDRYNQVGGGLHRIWKKVTSWPDIPQNPQPYAAPHIADLNADMANVLGVGGYQQSAQPKHRATTS